MEQLESISSAKDILIGYIVAHLNGQECLELYYNLVGKDKLEVIEGIELSAQEYSKLIYYWGEDKFNSVIKRYKELKDNGKFTCSKSAYVDLFKIARIYYEEEYWSGVNVVDACVTDKEEAKRYVKSTPIAARCGDEDVGLLTQVYGIDIVEETGK